MPPQQPQQAPPPFTVYPRATRGEDGEHPLTITIVPRGRVPVRVRSATFCSATRPGQFDAKTDHFALSWDCNNSEVPKGVHLKFSVVWRPGEPRVFQLYSAQLRLRIEANGVLHTSVHDIRCETGPPGVRARPGWKEVQPTSTYVPRPIPKRGLPRDLESSGKAPAARAHPDPNRAKEEELSRPVKCRLPHMYPLISVPPDCAQQLEKPLNIPNYGPKFTLLLQLEEHEERRILSTYCLNDALPVNVHDGGHRAGFRVIGLDESAACVSPGDEVAVMQSPPTRPAPLPTPPHRTSAPITEQLLGWVEAVTRDLVTIRLMRRDEKFALGKTYDVFFLPNRFTVLMRINAVDELTYHNRLKSSLMQRLGLANVIPTASAATKENQPPPAHSFLHLEVVKKLNQAQYTAVNSIATAPRGDPRPFILFGPPGTGKTTTLVAAACALLFPSQVNGHSDARLLIVAQSNSAVDNFLERFLAVLPPSWTAPPPNEPRRVVRLLATSREIPTTGYSAAATLASTRCWSAVTKARVVVTTCACAGKLSGADNAFPRFTHIFVDEAGQATEPDVLCALAFPFANESNLVLAGDHKQLGPVVFSPIAGKPGGLGLSLMERLMNTLSYSAPFNPNRVVQLLENYRSHSELVGLPSRLFYSGTLKAMRPHASLEKWKRLPTRCIPIILHHIQGLEARQAANPSWFNLSEAICVVNYVESLVNDTSLSPRVTADQIAVITPYRGQTSKISLLLRANNLEACRVGTVEVFQGQEARVVIISSVRSCATEALAEAKRHVGFLANPKRFNTSITRAQELLIVVGNTFVLECDEHWNELVQHCKGRGAVVGRTME